MCTGIVLRDGRHLQSIKDIECHFQCSLEPYKWAMTDPPLLKDCCTCQVDLDRFFSETKLVEKFAYDYVEWYEK